MHDDQKNNKNTMLIHESLANCCHKRNKTDQAGVNISNFALCVDYFPITANPITRYYFFFKTITGHYYSKMLYKVYALLKKYYMKSSFFGHKRAASHHYNKHIFICWAAAASLTQCPYEIVLRPQTEHGQVEVEDAHVKGLGVDVWVVNDAIHRTYAIEGKVDQQAKSTGAQLHQYVSLKQQVSPVSLGTNLSEIFIISWLNNLDTCLIFVVVR